MSEATEKPQMVTKASRSLTKESIGTSKVSVPFLYVLNLFLSSDIGLAMNTWLTRESGIDPGTEENER